MSISEFIFVICMDSLYTCQTVAFSVMPSCERKFNNQENAIGREDKILGTDKPKRLSSAELTLPILV